MVDIEKVKDKGCELSTVLICCCGMDEAGQVVCDLLAAIEQLQAREISLLDAIATRSEQIEQLQALPAQCRDALPWPNDLWPMTADQYVEAVPDGRLRTAVGGFLQREGWKLACEWIEERLKGGE